MTRTLWAVSDLHAAVKANTKAIDSIRPTNPGDWLIVAGDVAERTEKVLKVLTKLRKRFACVIWVPGNHELFSRSTDTCQGRAKYDELVEGCRRIDVLTPEDPFPVFGGVTIVPLFTLYDYSFRKPGFTVEQALQAADDRQVVLTDQFAIAPFVDIRAWCWDRLAYSIKHFGEPLAAGQRTVTTPCLARTQPVVRDSAHQELGETLQRTACHLWAPAHSDNHHC